jgi:hypothetical protein
MELPSLVRQVLLKCAPTTALENDKIANGCKLWYEKLIKATQEKQEEAKTLNFIDKLVLQLDTWYIQLVFALAYFVIVRFVQDLMNPGDDHQEIPE